MSMVLAQPLTAGTPEAFCMRFRPAVSFYPRFVKRNRHVGIFFDRLMLGPGDLMFDGWAWTNAFEGEIHSRAMVRATDTLELEGRYDGTVPEACEAGDAFDLIVSLRDN